MDVEAFFEKFALVVDAPGAISGIRELVLKFAFQGKLVGQLPSDEPAVQLLERIREEKKRLIAKRKIRRGKLLPIDAKEVLFDIPESWVWTRLGEIGQWGSGSTPARGNEHLYGGGITWLKSGELNDDRTLKGSSETVTEEALRSGSFKMNQTGDVLLAMYGATVGKAAILAEPAVTNQAVCGCTPFEGISNSYLYFFLLSQRERFRAVSEGGAQPNISRTKIVSFLFPLPPLTEQKRIVAKVDELMALCDQLEAQQQERKTRHAALARASLARFADAPTPANLEYLFHPSYSISPADLRKAILTLAVQGKLVPQDPSEELENATLLLRDVDSAEPIFAGQSLFELPSSWQWMRLGQVSELINGDRSKNYPNRSEYTTKGVAWINTGHIKPDGTLSLDSMHYITREKFDSLRSGKVQRGDLVYCLRGATLGKTAIVDQFKEGAIASSLVIIRFSQAINPRFGYRFLTSPLGQMYVSLFYNGAAQPNLSAASVRKYRIPVPPLSEQRRIVAKVDQLMTLVDELETQLTKSQTTAKKLLDAVVAELTAAPT